MKRLHRRLKCKYKVPSQSCSQWVHTDLGRSACVAFWMVVFWFRVMFWFWVVFWFWVLGFWVVFWFTVVFWFWVVGFWVLIGASYRSLTGQQPPRSGWSRCYKLSSDTGPLAPSESQSAPVDTQGGVWGKAPERK